MSEVFSNAGFSQDDLLAIGTRKTPLNLPISATDINRSITFQESKTMCENMAGFSEDELKVIGAGKAQAPGIRPEHINNMPVEFDNVMDNALSTLQSFLGIRTK